MAFFRLSPHPFFFFFFFFFSFPSLFPVVVGVA